MHVIAHGHAPGSSQFMSSWGCVVSFACESTMWCRVFGIAGNLGNTRMFKNLTL